MGKQTKKLIIKFENQQKMKIELVFSVDFFLFSFSGIFVYKI